VVDTLGFCGVLVLADGHQALAAEPGFHSDPPSGGGAVKISIGHDPNMIPKIWDSNWKILCADGGSSAGVGIERSFGRRIMESSMGTPNSAPVLRKRPWEGGTGWEQQPPRRERRNKNTGALQRTN
jgi:hypothetical protein